MQFAAPSEIKQPVGGLIIQEPLEQDHILGGFGPKWEEILPTGRWLDFAWEDPEIQVVEDGDTFWCVIFSHNSIWRFIHRKRYTDDFNCSERYPAIGSGTIRGRGNSKRNVAEWARLNGFRLQAECPTPRTLDECYAPLTDEDKVAGKKNLNLYEVGYKFLPGNKEIHLKAGLKFSPVQVDVEPYAFNAQGFIVNSGQGYIHEVALVQDMEGFWAIWDSESKQWLKFDKSYEFGTPMIHSLKKKFMLKMKQVGSAIYYQGLVDGLWHPVESGELFKDLLGEFGQYKIEPVVEIPTEEIGYTLGKK